MAPRIVVKSADPSGNAPTQEEVSSILHTIFTTQKSQDSLDASYALVNLLINSVGYRGLTSYGVLGEVRKAAGNKKDGAQREGAMFAIGALFERLPPAQPLSEVVFLLQEEDLVPITLDALADKGSTVRESAQYALDALFGNLGPEALIVALLPILVKYLKKKSGKWQGMVGAYSLLARMAEKAKIGSGTREEELIKDVLREAMGRQLEGLIPVVESGMHDLKSEVRITALQMKLCAKCS
jgi:elongation factor 3